MKELVIISGKGGTGKTSIVSSLAHLAGESVLADCDVDASDLHLVMSPSIKNEEDFKAGYSVYIYSEQCIGCGKCVDTCAFDAISQDFIIDPLKCEGCGVCAHFCPVQAIEMDEKTAGQWFESETPYGQLFHARLNVAEDNSGKLVTRVKEAAREYAKEHNRDLIIVDGPPGVGCPVISSISGSSMVLIVTEPTVSGLHDLKRVAGLAGHFRIEALVCINKYDINESVADEIEEFCRGNNIKVAARIPYSPEFTKAQVAGKALTEYAQGPAVDAVRSLWERVQEALNLKT